MSDLNLNFDSTGKEVSLDGDNKDTGITLNEGSSSDMLGIDLLSNKKNTKAELNVSSDIGGYSSDDGSVKSDQSKTKKEDFDFFSKIKESDKNDNIQEKNV